MDRSFQYFAVCIVLILVTAGLSYRLTLNAVDNRIDALDSRFSSLQSVIDSKSSATQSDLSSLRRDLEANTGSLRQDLGEKVSQLQKQVTSSRDQSSEQLSTALQDILGKVKEIEERSEKVEQRVSTVAVEGGDWSGIVDQVMPGIVSIRAGNMVGSGFFVTEEGLLVTNLHVVANAPDIKVVTADRVNYRATLLIFDEIADLALLRLVTPRKDFEFLTFGDSDAVNIGDPIAAIGSPGGYEFSVSKGVIGAKERREGGTHLFQLDVSINPGNSGGPVINKAGAVIGIAVGYRELEILGLDRIGFAIQSNYAKEKIDKMRNTVMSAYQ